MKSFRSPGNKRKKIPATANRNGQGNPQHCQAIPMIETHTHTHTHLHKESRPASIKTRQIFGRGAISVNDSEPQIKTANYTAGPTIPMAITPAIITMIITMMITWLGMQRRGFCIQIPDGLGGWWGGGRGRENDGRHRARPTPENHSRK